MLTAKVLTPRNALAAIVYVNRRCGLSTEKSLDRASAEPPSALKARTDADVASPIWATLNVDFRGVRRAQTSAMPIELATARIVNQFGARSIAVRHGKNEMDPPPPPTLLYASTCASNPTAA